MSNNSTIINQHIDSIRKKLGRVDIENIDKMPESKRIKMKKYIERIKEEEQHSIELIMSNDYLYNQLKNILSLYPEKFVTYLYKQANNYEVKVLHYVRSQSPKKYFKKLKFTYKDLTKYYGINERGDKLFLIKPLSIASDQNVYMSYLKLRNEKEPTHEFLYNLSLIQHEGNERILVIKWDKDKIIKREITGWKYYLDENLPNPGVRTDFTIFGYSSVVMRLLKRSQEIRNPFTYVDMGCQVLDILKKFHRFACHTDIKPDNIMYELRNGRTIYYLIDMCISYKPEKYGFFRSVWSPLYTCQNNNKEDIIVTYKHDLIELGITLNIIYSMCNGIPIEKKEYHNYVKDSRVWKYINYVESLDKTRRNENVYDHLKNILKNLV